MRAAVTMLKDLLEEVSKRRKMTPPRAIGDGIPRSGDKKTQLANVAIVPVGKKLAKDKWAPETR